MLGRRLLVQIMVQTHPQRLQPTPLLLKLVLKERLQLLATFKEQFKKEVQASILMTQRKQRFLLPQTVEKFIA